ncbi:MAG: hypothetical protein ACR2NN_02855 [Bryobacteraceae bacterium]
MNRKVSVAGGIVAVFLATVLILLRVMPGPHKATDYMVIGTLATFVCILLAFILFTATTGKRSEMFFKHKK